MPSGPALQSMMELAILELRKDEESCDALKLGLGDFLTLYMYRQLSNHTPIHIFIVDEFYDG